MEVILLVHYFLQYLVLPDNKYYQNKKAYSLFQETRNSDDGRENGITKTLKVLFGNIAKNRNILQDIVSDYDSEHFKALK